MLEKIGPEINALIDIIHKLGKDKRSSGEEALTKLSKQVAALTAEAKFQNAATGTYTQVNLLLRNVH